jgi:hypothetical protein
LLLCLTAACLAPLVFSDDSDASGGARIGNEEFGSVAEALLSSVPGDVVYVVPDAKGAATIEGDVVVPEFVTLVLPYSADCGPSGTADGESMDDTSAKVSVDRYMTLTVAKKSSLMVEGTLIVGGVLSRPFSFDYQGHTSGPFAQLTLNGSLTVDGGGSLYCYGFIKGSGTVRALAGASVHEPMMVTDFVGGDAAYCSYNGGQSPFNRYALCNIQSGYSMEGGAVLYGMVNLYANGSYNKGEAPVVGTDAGLLKLGEGSVLSSTYKAEEYVQGDWESNIYKDVGKKHVTIKGGAATGSISIEVQGNRADTAHVSFSVPYNFDFTLSDGDYVINDKFRFLPGSGLTVASDANLTVKGTLLMYDGLADHEYRDKYYPGADLLGKYGFDKIATFVVDGAVTVQGTLAGAIQATEPGAVVKTSPGSVLGLQASFGADGNVGTTHINYRTVRSLQAYVFKPSGDLLPLTPGRTYTSVDTAEHVIESFEYSDRVVNKTYTVALGQKVIGSWQSEPLRVIYDANRGEGSPPMDFKEYTEGDRIVVQGPGELHKANSEFLGWSLRSDSKSSLIMPGDEYVLRGDLTLYAAWTVGHFYVETSLSSKHAQIVQGERQDLEEHSDASVTVVPDEGYAVKEVFVDGVSVGNPNVVRFPDITSSHNVRVVLTAAEGTVSSLGPDGSVTERCRIVDGSATAESEKVCDSYGHVSLCVRYDGGAGASGEALKTGSGSEVRVIMAIEPAASGSKATAEVRPEMLEEAVSCAKKAAEMADVVYMSPAVEVVVEGSYSDIEVRIGPDEFLQIALGDGLDVDAGGWEAHVPSSLLRTVRNAVGSPEVTVSMLQAGTYRFSLSAEGEANPSAGPEYSVPDDLTVKKDGWEASIPASLAVRMARSSVAVEFGNVEESGSVKGDLRLLSFSGSLARKVPTAVGDVSFSSPDGWGLSIPASAVAGWSDYEKGFRLAVGASGMSYEGLEGKPVAVLAGTDSADVLKAKARILASMPYSLRDKTADIHVFQAESDGSRTERPSSLEGGVLSFDAYGTSEFLVEEESHPATMPEIVAEIISYAVIAVICIGALAAALVVVVIWRKRKA